MAMVMASVLFMMQVQLQPLEPQLVWVFAGCGERMVLLVCFMLIGGFADLKAIM